MIFRTFFLLFAWSFILSSCSGGASAWTSIQPSTENESSPGDDEGDSGDTGGSDGSGSAELSTLTSGFNLSSSRIHLRSNQSKTITVHLDSPATEASSLPYRVYSPYRDEFSQLLSTPGDEIYVPSGATSFSFELSFPNAPSFTNQGNFYLVLDSTKVAQSGVHIHVHNSNKTDFDSITVGSEHACGIDGGALYCWGYDTAGKIGNGTSMGSLTAPQRIGTSTTWTQVSAGEDHTCGIDNGALYCWGWGGRGQVGNGALSSRVEDPLRIGTSNTWTQISAGEYHTCGIDSGALYCWGRNYDGQVGNGSSSGNVLAPERIGTTTTWTLVSAGYDHTCGIDNGALYCWGSDSSGQVGNGSTKYNDVTAPEQIGTSSTWTQVSASESHTCGIDNGALFCWGWDNAGRIGNGAPTSSVDAPLQIGTSTTWNQISAGGAHTCGLNNGALYCWGSDAYGQIGNGSNDDDVTAPEQIGEETSWTFIEGGEYSTCGIINGNYKCWGLDDKSVLGQDAPAVYSGDAPTEVDTNTSWSQVSSGYGHKCGIREGELYCWGTDDNGQIGNGASSNAKVLVPEKIGVSQTWTQVTTGKYHTCGIDNGALYCWGEDYVGQIGNGAAINSDVTAPERIGTSNTWTAISAGSLHTCGIDNGALYCWGEDYAGQVGNGSATNSDVTAPERIGTSSTWTAISAGNRHTCGIDNGALYCWGDDSDGRVGNGVPTGVVTTPERIGTSNTWTAISAGNLHTCGIDNGALFCWGEDYTGQVGNGSATNSDVTAPERIGTSTTWSKVSAGGNHTCGIDSGALFCWGYDMYGEVGNGAATGFVVEPAQIGTSTNWTEVSAGSTHTSGIDAGTLYRFGASMITSRYYTPGD